MSEKKKGDFQEIRRGIAPRLTLLKEALENAQALDAKLKEYEDFVAKEEADGKSVGCEAMR